MAAQDTRSDSFQLATGQSPIKTLPPEILHHVFSWLDPEELHPVSQVCRLFHDFISHNQSLCRDIYLKHFDIPPASAKMNWETELHDVVRLETLLALADKDADKQLHRLEFVFDTVTRLLRNATPGESYDELSTNVEHLHYLFERHEVGAKTLMQQSFLFDRMRRSAFQGASHPPPARERERQQMSAKLHCLYGSPMMQYGRTRSSRTYPYACSRVYDLRQYTAQTRWGPFRDDETDRVDWEKLEAIAIVIAKNVTFRWPRADIFEDVFGTSFYGSFSNSFAYQDANDGNLDFGDKELDEQDPYGVTGYWYRVVCFLDYSDFFHYNFSMDGLIEPHAPRPPLNVGEAARIIVLKLQVTAVEPPGEDDDPDWPVVHYTGDSRALDERFDESAISGLRGTVRMTKEGEVRWSSVSVFDGQERWRSEGVQIGGAKSARGVWGNWFDKDYDPHGPAGPTAFWKASEVERPRDAMRTGLSAIVVDPFGHGRFPAGLATALQAQDIGELAELAELDDVEYVDAENEWEDEEYDEEEWLAGLRPLLAEELPRLLRDQEIGEAELALIRQELGLED